MPPPPDAQLPKVNKPLMGGFRVFNRRYLRKHFHVVAQSRASGLTNDIPNTDSIVVYANHASWWDPLLAIFLAENLYPSFGMYAPIDAEAFEKYRIFGQMGFYPVAQNSLEGAKHFLKVSKAILAQKANSIWLTPEGRFADVRDHKAALMPGLAHLGHALGKRKVVDLESPKVWFIPLAIEYCFWEEKMPELLIRFGNPVATGSAEAEELADKEAWDKKLTGNLREAQRDLAELSIARDSAAFEVMLRSRSGTFFIYDWWRSLSSRLRGKQMST